MSYILDALKKSEQARGSRKKDLGLINPPDSPPPVKSNERWLYLIAFMLLLNAGLFAFWLHPWQRDANTHSDRKAVSDRQTDFAAQQPVLEGNKQGTSATQAEQTEDAALRLSKAAPVVAAGQKEDGQSKSQGAGKTSDGVKSPETDAPHQRSVQNNAGENKNQVKTGVKQDQKSGAHRPNQMPAQPPPRSPGGPGTTEATAQKSDTPKLPQDSAAGGTKHGSKTTKPPGMKKPAETGGQRLQGRTGDGILSDLQDFAKLEESSSQPASAIPKWHELAPEIRSAIPNLAVSMLIYSKSPESRWININGSKKQEGQEIAPGLKVEQIMPDGAILNYRGQRFFKRVVGD